MDSYAKILISNIRKIFYLPKNTKQLENDIIKIMNKMKSKQLDRQQIVDDLFLILSKLKRIPTSPSTRTDERINIIIKMLGNRKLKTILDIGAGTGEIVSLLGKHYNLAKTQIFAIDEKLPELENVTPLTYIEGKIPLEDNSIDLIIMFVVLHHIEPESRNNILKEIVRILSPNGVVIIREHDDDKNPNFYNIIELIHMFWYIVNDETSDPLYLMSRTETQKLFEDVGLKSINYVNYPEPNPQRLYHEMFNKTDDFVRTHLTNSSKVSYNYLNIEAKDTLQSFIDKIKLNGPDKSNELIPRKLLDVVLIKYQNNVRDNWTEIIKMVAIAIIVESMKYAVLKDNVQYITLEGINLAIKQLS